MLVLSRKKNESVVVNDNIVITVVEVRGDKVRLGIQAPKDIQVLRSELVNPQPPEMVEIEVELDLATGPLSEFMSRRTA